MWKNWFPFRRKEEKKTSPSVASSESQKNGKENGRKNDTIQMSGGNGDGAVGQGELRLDRRPILDREKMSNRFPGSQPRSPFTRSVNYMENNGPTVPGETSVQPARSVLNPRGPLLSSPLLPKIKRAIELNDSLTLRYVLNEGDDSICVDSEVF